MKYFSPPVILIIVAIVIGVAANAPKFAGALIGTSVIWIIIRAINHAALGRRGR